MGYTSLEIAPAEDIPTVSSALRHCGKGPDVFPGLLYGYTTGRQWLVLPSPHYGVEFLLQVGDESAVGWSPVGRYRAEAQRQLVAVTLDLAPSLSSLTVCPLQIT